MSFYLDTNVIVALFRAEPASAVAAAWLARISEPALISDFGAVEFAAVLSRDIRAGIVAEPQANAIVAGFDVWRSKSVRLVTLSAADTQRAEAFVRDFSTKLQAPDALHLSLASRTGATLVTFDMRLTEAARQLSLAVVAPH